MAHSVSHETFLQLIKQLVTLSSVSWRWLMLEMKSLACPT